MRAEPRSRRQLVVRIADESGGEPTGEVLAQWLALDAAVLAALRRDRAI